MEKSPIELSQQVSEARYFSFANRQGSDRMPVNIFFGGLEHCRQDYGIDRHGFPFNLLEYVVDGAGELTLQGEAFPLRKGSYYIYGPDIPCKILNDPERPLVKYFFAFHCHGSTLETLQKMERRYFEPGQTGGLVGDLVRLLFNEGCSPEEGSWRICCYYLDVIILKSAQGIKQEQFRRERAWQVFQEIKEYIEDNFLELYRMEDIAVAAGRCFLHLPPVQAVLPHDAVQLPPEEQDGTRPRHPPADRGHRPGYRPPGRL